MAEEEGFRTTRRKAIKTIGAGSIGAASISLSSTPVAAQSSWSATAADSFADTVGDGYFEHHLGAGLEHVDTKTGDTGYDLVFDVAGDGVVLNEDNEMPITEEEGYSDEFPRTDHRGNAGKQGIIIEEISGTLNLSFDGEEASHQYMFPEDGTEYEDGTTDIFEATFDLAFTALASPAQQVALSGGILAKEVLEFALGDGDSSEEKWDFVNWYGDGENGFLRGGHGQRFEIEVNEGDGGTFRVTSVFGVTEIAWEIHITHGAGMSVERVS